MSALGPGQNGRKFSYDRLTEAEYIFISVKLSL